MQFVKSLSGKAIIRFCVIDPECVSLRQVHDELYNVLAGSRSHSGENHTGFSFNTLADKKSKYDSVSLKNLYSMQKLNAKYNFGGQVAKQVIRGCLDGPGGLDGHQGMSINFMSIVAT